MRKRPGIRWNHKVSPAMNARRHLPGLASAYFSEARTLLDEADRPAGLHRLRLISKRLRYSLEMFRPVYSVGLRYRIEALKRVQDLLGDINDVVATGRLIETIPGSGRMRGCLDQMATAKAAEFRAEWRTHFDAPGREAWWTDFLAR